MVKTKHTPPHIQQRKVLVDVSSVVAKDKIVFSGILKNLKTCTSRNRLYDIRQFITAEFNKHYSKFTCNDHFDSVVLFNRNKQGKIISTGRVIFDGLLNLPADHIVKNEVNKLRKKRLRIAEISNFAISKEDYGIRDHYIRAFFLIAREKKIDLFIFICKKKKAVAYKRLVGAEILISDIQYSYGTKETFSLLVWQVKKNKYHHKAQNALEMK